MKIIGSSVMIPMYQVDKPTMVTIVEIYASEAARDLHLKTPHFQYYKTTTLKMVKSLTLVSMKKVDPETIPLIFEKY